jgi:hypothetical protein
MLYISFRCYNLKLNQGDLDISDFGDSAAEVRGPNLIKYEAFD